MNLSPFCFRVPSLHALQRISGIRFPTKTEGKFYQSLSCVQLFATPWTAACQASLSFTISWSLLKLMSIKSVMPSNHLISIAPFSCPQSSPASGSFPVSQFFVSGGQSIGSFSFSIFLPMNIQDWLPLGLTGLISLQSKESSPTQQLKHINSLDSIFFILQLSCPYDYWKNHSFD